MIRIGPAGNSLSFYEQGNKHTFQAPVWLNKIGLNAFEYSFGRGISMSAPTAEKIGDEMKKYDIQISVHAPYYINFASSDQEKIFKTREYVLRSIEAAKMMGAERVVVHPGAQGSLTRNEAMDLAARNFDGIMEYLDGNNAGGTLCIETLGRFQQIGTVEEVLRLIKPYKNVLPCIDFGHINCYTLGGLKSKDDYRRVFDLIISELGERRARDMHIHFSKIMYGKSGEIKHLTFEDATYGPDYRPMCELIKEYKLQPTIICESDGTMAEDALSIKKLLT